jgi:sulfur-oxidizing protein SoxY
VGAGLLTPGSVLAAWPKAAFEAKTVDDALKGVGMSGATESGDIKIKAPDIAENGAVVPVTVSTSLSGVTNIGLVVVQNGTPLSSTYDLAKGTHPYISTRIKMGKTSDVVAIVKAGDKVLSAKKEVKVTIGGCGG